MKRSSRVYSFLFLVCFVLLLANETLSQEQPKSKLSSLDQSIKAGLDAVSDKKYQDSTRHFETALQVMEKDKAPSEYLFTKLSLPDEDPNNPPRDARAQAIEAWRHAMGTRQALLSFLAFSYQLAGNKAQSDKYFDEVYGMQGPLWGLSWRLFVPRIQGVFHLAVPAETTENYGRYLFLSGQLMDSVGEDIALKFFQEAQKLLPKDRELAAELASYYVVRLDAANAKKQAELSLSFDPKQKRVLIDLATAEWLLDDYAAAAKHAGESIAIDPKMPGPHATLSLIAIEKNDLSVAEKEAETGVRLSERHPYYLAIQAIVMEAGGKSAEADRLIREAWQEGYPSTDDLKKWFLKGKPLEVLTRIIKRQK